MISSAGDLPPFLVDTSILLRLAEPATPKRAVVVAALAELTSRGQMLCVAPQNLIEYWNVATRPVDKNGFGLTPEYAEHQVRQIEDEFARLPETPDLYPVWRQLAGTAGVSGKQVHDTRLVAFMAVNKVPNLLTLNGRDFTRFTEHTGITVVDPMDV